MPWYSGYTLSSFWTDWRRRARICSSDAVGRCWIRSAAAPETAAAACELPLPRMKRSSSVATPPYSSSIFEPGTRTEATRLPGAMMSGLRSFSPICEKLATPSSR